MTVLPSPPIDLGERSATLMYMGPGHTDGDILVGIEDVLFMGGLIEEGTDPYFEDSFPDRWIGTLGAVLELTVTACLCPVTVSR